MAELTLQSGAVHPKPTFMHLTTSGTLAFLLIFVANDANAGYGPEPAVQVARIHDRFGQQTSVKGQSPYVKSFGRR